MMVATERFPGQLQRLPAVRVEPATSPALHKAAAPDKAFKDASSFDAVWMTLGVTRLIHTPSKTGKKKKRSPTRKSWKLVWGKTRQFAAGKGGLTRLPGKFTAAARNDPVSVGNSYSYRGDWSCMCLVFKGSVISATWLGNLAHVVYLKWLFGDASKTKKIWNRVSEWVQHRQSLKTFLFSLSTL